jgi:hypothetical protein
MQDDMESCRANSDPGSPEQLTCTDKAQDKFQNCRGKCVAE